jgi:hypothetical protein
MEREIEMNDVIELSDYLMDYDGVDRLESLKLAIDFLKVKQLEAVSNSLRCISDSIYNLKE